jgi:ribosomal protein S18 acetylase RimI-like enzyme
VTVTDLVDDLDAYLDAAPRPDSDPVPVGPFTLFVSRSPWPYYARPTVGQRAPITAEDVRSLVAACAEHGVRPAIEWVHEVHPELAAAAAASGLAVSTHVLMAAPADEVQAPHVEGVTVRLVPAGDPALPAGNAVAHVAFGAGGTTTGPQGPEERDAVLAGLDPALVAHLHDRTRRGLTLTAVAESATQGVVAVGSVQPVGGLAEIVGVATLPSARRRGLGAALTAALARHAAGLGVHTVLLSAQDEAVAAIYARTGFRRVGTSHAAEPAD